MPVDLHRAKSIEELNQQASTANITAIYKSAKPEGLYKMAKIMHQQIIQSKDDSELAYIYAFRCLKLLEVIFTRDTDSRFVHVQFDGMRKEVSKIFTDLKVKLKARYDQLEKEKLIEKDKEAEKIEVPNDDKIYTSVIGKKDDIFISPPHLYQDLKKVADKTLIIDIRTANEFKESQLNGNYNLINIDNVLIERGMSAFKLEQKLDEETRKIYAKRDHFQYIVLLDNDTVKGSFHTSKLKILYDMLTIWDVNKNYHHAPYVLNGGYVDFIDMFPTLSTNPHVVCAVRYSDLDDILDLDAITYPPVESLQMKETAEKLLQDLIKQCEMIETTERELMGFETILLNKLKKREPESCFNEKDERLEYERAEADLQRRVYYERKAEVTNELIKWVKKYSLDEAEFLNRPELLNFERRIVELSRKRRKVGEELKTYESKEVVEEPPRIEPDQVETVEHEEKKPDPSLLDSSGDNSLRFDEMPRILHDVRIPQRLRPVAPVVNRATKPLVGTEGVSGLNGLYNIRNSCYMNAVVQCLRHLPRVRYFFISGEYKQQVTIQNPKLIMEFGELVRNLWLLNKVAIRPQEFYNAITRLYPEFGRGNHEDANEFFIIMFGYLNDDVSSSVRGTERYRPADWNSFYRATQQKRSFFIKNFYYQIRTDCYCRFCQKREMRFETENVLILDLPSRGHTSLENLVNTFMTTYDVSTMICSKCEKAPKFERTISYQPKIITVLLKRYGPNRSGGLEKKLTGCSYPLDGLMFGPGRYKLFGLCLHRGTMASGHYIAICRNVVNNKWYEFNDDTVNQVEMTSTLFEKDAYLLFYQLMDDKMVGFQ